MSPMRFCLFYLVVLTSYYCDFSGSMVGEGVWRKGGSGSNIVEAYPTYLTLPVNCVRKIAPGTVIMSNAAKNSTARYVVVTRDGVSIPSGSMYIPGEVLVASISDTTGKYIIEVRGGGNVTLGGCNNTRRALNPATFTIPTTLSGNISIVTAWTTSHSVPVSVNPIPFILIGPPTSAPTFSPTRAPSAPSQFSYQPTIAPTASPTVAPTIAPSFPETAIPTIAPVSVPSDPTAFPTTESMIAGDDVVEQVDQSSFSALPEEAKGIVGFIFGAVSLVVLTYGLQRLADYRLNNPDTRYLSEKTLRFSRISSVLAIIMAIIATIMVIKWAKPITVEDPLLLGKLSWSDNLFVYHPVLMVGGMFLGQVIAICSWNLYPNYFVARFFHFFWQFSATVCMFVGFHAVYRNKVSQKELHYTSMHSWIGVAAIGFICLSMSWGGSIYLLVTNWPESVFRKAFDLRTTHRTIGIVAFSFTSLSIVTGIMDQLPHGICDPVLTDPHYVTDAAWFYPNVFPSCRLAHGLGIVVIIATGLTYLTVAYRGDSFGRDRMMAAQMMLMKQQKKEHRLKLRQMRAKRQLEDDAEYDEVEGEEYGEEDEVEDFGAPVPTKFNEVETVKKDDLASRSDSDKSSGSARKRRFGGGQDSPSSSPYSTQYYSPSMKRPSQLIGAEEASRIPNDDFLSTPLRVGGSNSNRGSGQNSRRLPYEPVKIEHIGDEQMI